MEQDSDWVGEKIRERLLPEEGKDEYSDAEKREHLPHPGRIRDFFLFSPLSPRLSLSLSLLLPSAAAELGERKREGSRLPGKIHLPDTLQAGFSGEDAIVTVFGFQWSFRFTHSRIRWNTA